MTELVGIDKEDGVLIVTLRRSDKKNALTGAMYEKMIEALEIADAEASIGAVLFQGENGVFCAGNDIGDFVKSVTSGGPLAAFRFVRALATCDTAMVAAVDGPAVGIGTTMLFHCDLAYATAGAKFRMPFVDLGLVPEAASSLLAPQRFGMAKASEFLLLGDGFGAQEAHRLNLINEIVDPSLLFGRAFEQARRLAAKPRGALAATRKLLRGDRDAVVKRIEEEAQAFSRALASSEAQAAFMAFMGKGKA